MLAKLNHGVYQIEIHFYFIAKCRYKIFRKEVVKKLVADVFHATAEKHDIELTTLGIADEHVHGTAILHPSMSVARFEQIMKGCSAYALFRIFPGLRKRYPRGHLWGRNKGVRSVGDTTVDTARDYVLRHNTNQTVLNDF